MTSSLTVPPSPTTLDVVFAAHTHLLLKIAFPDPLVSSVLMGVGAGLISTFEATGTGHSRWIGYQVIYGLGVGFGMQQPIMAAQTVLSI